MNNNHRKRVWLSKSLFSPDQIRNGIKEGVSIISVILIVYCVDFPDGFFDSWLDRHRQEGSYTTHDSCMEGKLLSGG